MQLANQHFTLVLGIDVHINTLPPFNPLHPFIGLVLDPMDYIPFIGGTVYINGRQRGVSDTGGMLITWQHIPLFTGPFALMPMIGHESINFFGSVNTFADGSRLSPTAHMVMSCNDKGAIAQSAIKMIINRLPFQVFTVQCPSSTIGHRFEPGIKSHSR